MNICVHSGRLTKDPVLKSTESGTDMVRFTLAVRRKYSEDIDFINYLAFGAAAKYMSLYCHKGDIIQTVSEQHAVRIEGERIWHENLCSEVSRIGDFAAEAESEAENEQE